MTKKPSRRAIQDQSSEKSSDAPSKSDTKSGSGFYSLFKRKEDKENKKVKPLKEEKDRKSVKLKNKDGVVSFLAGSDSELMSFLRLVGLLK